MSSLYTRGNLDFKYDGETSKLMNVELQVAVINLPPTFASQALTELLTLIGSGEYYTFFGENHEIDFNTLDNWYEEKLKKTFKDIMVKNGVMIDTQAQAIEELTVACKASLK